MSSAAHFEDGPPNIEVAPRRLAAGEAQSLYESIRVELLGPGAVLSHGGPTPTTYTEPDWVARVIAFLELARQNIDESHMAGSPIARISATIRAQGCIDSALGLLR